MNPLNQNCDRLSGLAVLVMATPAPSARRLCFDVFELDVRAGQLRKRGVRLRLQGQPLQVLATLLKRAGDVVTLEELRAEIWTADTFVDFDHSLHNAIARLREVLGDSAERPRYIETLPRRGYRFIAPVHAGELPAASGVADSAPPGDLPGHLRLTKSHALWLTTVFAVLLISIAFWLARTGGAPTSAAPRLNSIAVLPLDNLSGDPSQEFFADGMTDQLITDLAKVGSLRVISRTSVLQYKGTKKVCLKLPGNCTWMPSWKDRSFARDGTCESPPNSSRRLPITTFGRIPMTAILAMS